MTGWTQTFEVMPALLVAGGSFGVMQFCWSNFVETNLVEAAAFAAGDGRLPAHVAAN